MMAGIQLPTGGKAVGLTVRRWHVQPGESFEAGQVLASCDSHSALVQVRAPQAGVLGSILVQVGQSAEPGQLIAQTADSSAATAAPTTATSASAAAPSQASAESSSMSSPATDAADLNVTPVLMPEAGNSMEEGTILSWSVSEGDAISEGQVICEIETDKASIEYESPVAGRLAKIIAQVDDIVPVKEPIAVLADDDADAAAYVQSLGGDAPTSAASTPAATPTASSDEPAVDIDSLAVTPVLMPEAGNSMEEGTILSWTVSEGDTISEGQVICEIETDKASIEYESPVAGRLAKIIAQVDDTVPVKEPIAVLADDDAQAAMYVKAVGAIHSPANSPTTSNDANTTTTAASPSPPAASQSEISNQQSAVTASNGRIKASPAARRLAAEQGLDLASITAGSGPGGRIISNDLTSARPIGASASAPVAAGAGTPVQIDPVATLTGDPLTPVARPMTKMRKAIASNLQQSKQTVPHFYVRKSFDAAAMLAYYKANKPATGCTLNDVMLKAVASAMVDFPAVRSRLQGDAAHEFPAANIGVAVGVPDGLVVPVLVGVDRMGLSQLAVESKRVVENARNGKLENMGKASFTISNMGMFGVEEFAAIINPPEAGILAVSAIRETVIVENGAMRPGKVMTLTMSADHRIVDGMLAAQFMGRLCEILENPHVLG